MESTGALLIPASCETERGVPTSHEIPPLSLIGVVLPAVVAVDHYLINTPSAALKGIRATDAAIGGHPGRGDDIALLARLVADTLRDSIAGLRKDEEARASQFTDTLRELSAVREREEKGIARLEKAITDLKPPTINNDPTTTFWTVYKKVADEHDGDLVSKYAGDLDTSLLFAGLFSAVATTFIVQIIPQIQPNPVDLTNVLLLRILQQNTSFGGADPLAPIISNIPTGIVKAQSILFASLSITLVVAFVAVLGKQWILYYTRVTTWGNIVDRGRERQVKFVGLQKWGLHLIMESLPVMLQFALLLFGIALAVYLWDLNISAAEVVSVATSIGIIFYTCIAVAATVRSDCPFQTPLSILLPKVLPWMKEFTGRARVRLRRKATPLLLRIGRATEHSRLTRYLGHLCMTLIGGTSTPKHPVEDVFSKHYAMTLSNPAFWRNDPLFTSPVPKDIAASAGFWLLENSTDFSAASAVAAVFSEIQWPSHHRSTTALIRLRDTYMECFRTPDFKKSTRLKALQSAAAYYVLYHTQLIGSTSKSLKVEVEKLPPDLPPDLFVHPPSDNKWDGDDVFEYLLHIEDRSEPVTSAQFLSYIAPFWFCGDSDAAIKFRPSRLQTLKELIEVLEKSQVLNPATVTDCILCAGAAMDFPLHPEDLIRVDKSDYCLRTFKMVVEHIHGIILARSRRRRHAEKALEILLTLVEKTTLPLVDAAWINELLKSIAGGNMDDDTFTLFLRLSARRKDEEAGEVGTPPGQDDIHTQGGETEPQPPGGAVTLETSAPEDTLFSKILKNVQTCIEREIGWQDEAVYGGLITMRDNPPLGPYPPDDDALQTLYNAMEKSKPFRVRKAAYDVILVVHDRWLKSAELRQTLEDLDFPRQLYGVVMETALPDHQRSFLGMMEILSEDRYWHPYLRRAMDIWLPFHHAGRDQVLHILTIVGELLLPRYDGSNPPFDKFLEKCVEDEWAGVPGRSAQDLKGLTADRLTPLAEVTKRLGELVFTDNGRKAVLAVVERVVPSLERRRDDGYDGPGEDIHDIVNDLLENLRLPMQSTSRRSTYWI